MKITEIRVAFGRTFTLPGGDKYQPARIDCEVTVAMEEGNEDEVDRARILAQTELRRLMEETYRAQCTKGSTP